MESEAVELAAICWLKAGSAMMGIWMSRWVCEESSARDCVRGVRWRWGRAGEGEGMGCWGDGWDIGRVVEEVGW